MGKSVRYTYGCYYKPDSEYKPTCFAAFYARRARQRLRNQQRIRNRQRIATPRIATIDEIDFQQIERLFRSRERYKNAHVINM